MAHLLGIDLGTSAVKVLLCDHHGNVVKRFARSYPTDRPHPHWAEQDPSQWWSAVCAVLRECEGQRVDAVGLSGQMHGPVFVGSEGQPLYPCMIWADTRAYRQSIALKRRLTETTLLRITGNPASEAFSAPKALWFKRHKPQAFRQVHKILLPKDFIGQKLTGECATDHSDASGTLLYDIHRGSWSDEIVTALDIERSFLPDIVDSATLLGRVTPAAAQQTGLRAGTPVTVGAGDLATALTGAGVSQEEVPLVNIGTAAQVIVPLRAWREQIPGKLYLFRTAEPQGLFAMGTVPGAGAALQWYADNLGRLESLTAADRGVDVFEVLDESAAQAPPGAHGLFFLPYMLGTGNPYLDYRVQGALLGLRPLHTRADIVRALMEGVAYGLRDCLNTFEIRPRKVRMGSGGARGAAWRQIVADVLGADVELVKEKDLSALGACLLAGVAVGVFHDLGDALGRVQIEACISPSENARARYAEGYEIFAALYHRLRNAFHRIDRLSS